MALVNPTAKHVQEFNAIGAFCPLSYQQLGSLGKGITMKSTSLLALLALLAGAMSTPLLAGDCDHDPRRDRQPAADTRAKDGFDYSMQAVAHDASPDTPGYWWRYFAAPAETRAVVISPEGNYYYSHGNGLHWIAAELK